MKKLQGAGLRGQSAGQTSLSTVEQEGSLRYLGFSIEDLASHASFEEVAYLLLLGELPNKNNLEQFENELFKLRTMPDSLVKVVESIPAEAHPMEVVRTIISYMGVIEPEKTFDDQLSISKRLLGVTTTAIVYWYKYSHEGVRIDQETGEKSVAAHFLKLLRQEDIQDLHKKTLDVSLTLYAEHEFNASTFTGRVCASTLSDLHSCLTAAVGSLRGPLHGGANEEAMKMLEEIDSVDEVKTFVDKKLENKEKIMGFGHAVYSIKDPRSDIIKEYSSELSKDHKDKKLHDSAVIMEAYLKEKKGLFPNTDFFHAPAYHYLGIPTKLFTPLFAIARIVGWSAHAFEQRDNNRIIRPSADYIGPGDRSWIDIESR